MIDINQKSLLIVDNEPLIAEELEEFFTDHGFVCYSCFNATEATSLYNKNLDIQLVISDLHMPGENGLVLLQQLMLIAQQQNRLIEAILFTGRSEKDDVIMALKAGIADYYQKPLDMDALLKGVQLLAKKIDQQTNTLVVDSLHQRISQLTESLEVIYQDVHQLNQGSKSKTASHH